MLGKLATYLRMCGYDAAYALDRGVESDDALLDLARTEERALLTRDVELAGRATRGVHVSSLDVEAQLRELRDAGFVLELDAPARCSACNGRLDRVAAGAVTPDYAPAPDETAVWRCTACGQHFWRGSHWADVRERLAAIE